MYPDAITAGTVPESPLGPCYNFTGSRTVPRLNEQIVLDSPQPGLQEAAVKSHETTNSALDVPETFSSSAQTPWFWIWVSSFLEAWWEKFAQQHAVANRRRCKVQGQCGMIQSRPTNNRRAPAHQVSPPGIEQGSDATEYVFFTRNSVRDAGASRSMCCVAALDRIAILGCIPSSRGKSELAYTHLDSLVVHGDANVRATAIARIKEDRRILAAGSKVVYQMLVLNASSIDGFELRK